MISIRKNTFETNSSSTHSLSISQHDSEWDRLQYIFKTILYGDKDNWIDGITDICNESQLLELLKLLNEAQQILLNGIEEYD